jgi:outer membrane biosynthesis protein TonB
VQSRSDREYDQPPNDLPRRTGFRLAIAFITLFATPSSNIATVHAEAATALPSASRQFAFDIPSQPLAAALEAYSVTTRREVVYNGKLAMGRQSTAVRGTFTPEAALQQLLEGSGLTPRYMAADGFVLMPIPADRPRLPVNTAAATSVAHYYGVIQAGLRQIFCADSRTQPGSYRVALSFWIDGDGRVSRTLLLGTTGAPDLDARIERSLHTLTIGAPPPGGFAQPVTLIVTPQPPQIGRDCQFARAVQPALRGTP